MDSRFNTRQSVLLLTTLWAFIYSTFTLLSPPLLDDADSVHAEVAREMLLRRDPVTLYANGIRYLEKAPLLYWSMAAGMRVFGVNAAAARFPLALFTLALILCTYGFARRAFQSERTGLYAGAALGLSFGIFIFTRILIPDALVCLWTTAALYAFWVADDSISNNRHAPTAASISFAAACALNILSKGLIGLVFPIGSITLYIVCVYGWREAIHRLRAMHPVTTIATFIAIAAPWHVAADLANPTEGTPPQLTHAGPWLHPFRNWHLADPTVGNVHGWAWFYFINEHALRYLDLRVPRDYDTVPLLLFWSLVFVWMLPASAFLIPALRSVPWSAVAARLRARVFPKAPQQLTTEARVTLLLAIAAIVPIAFFSFSTRQEYYVLPALPFLAILTARWLDGEATKAESLATPAPRVTTGQRVTTVALCIAAPISIAIGIFLIATRNTAAGTDLASLLTRNPGDYALSFGHFLDLNAAALATFRTPLAMTAAALAAGALAAWWLRREYQPHRSNIAIAAAATVFLVAAHKALNTFSPVLTSAGLAAQLAPLVKPTDLIVINDEYEAGSSLGFYLQRADIHIWHGHSANLWYGSFFTDAPHIFETDETIRQRWSSTQRIFLWTDPAKLPQLPGPVIVVAEGGGKQIVTNQRF